MQDPKGDYLPPPPPPLYQVTSDIPPDSPYHYAPAPRQTGRQAAGWLGGAAAALFALFKYGGVLLLKLPALGTLVSVLISFAGYAWLRGPWFAAALISMIFVHEMGHVLEIRRQGMQATAPIFIPFLGAAIFQRSHPTSALKQAQIGIAGPIAGTIGATAAYLLYLSTGWDVLLLAAVLGFIINLFNLIPVWQLDGSWILAPVSKWVYVAGYGLVVLAILWLHSIFLIIIAVFGLSSLVQRFRAAQSPYYTSVPVRARWALGAAWLALVVYLGVMTAQSLDFFNPFVQ
ncbi:MAG: site-2 protease family protein [Chloroflexi bacterium]|nr:MAG: site-2 protease family protein [Chloroflexota bacterium]TME91492.1 MAG: site-2 protease family protein [Chloroflexota bacterium]